MKPPSDCHPTYFHYWWPESKQGNTVSGGNPNLSRSSASWCFNPPSGYLSYVRTYLIYTEINMNEPFGTLLRGQFFLPNPLKFVYIAFTLSNAPQNRIQKNYNWEDRYHQLDLLLLFYSHFRLYQRNENLAINTCSVPTCVLPWVNTATISLSPFQRHSHHTVHAAWRRKYIYNFYNFY